MRERLREQLRDLAIWLCLWVLSRVMPAVVQAPDPIDARALVLVLAQEAFAGRSGEAKRHQVYAQLLKEFPEVSKRAVSMAIERSLGGPDGTR